MSEKVKYVYEVICNECGAVRDISENVKREVNLAEQHKNEQLIKLNKGHIKVGRKLEEEIAKLRSALDIEKEWNAKLKADLRETEGFLNDCNMLNMELNAKVAHLKADRQRLADAISKKNIWTKGELNHLLKKEADKDGANNRNQS